MYLGITFQRYWIISGANRGYYVVWTGAGWSNQYNHAKKFQTASAADYEKQRKFSANDKRIFRQVQRG